MLGNRRYCYPLTISDYSSRYLLACEALESTREPLAFTTFERVLREYGLPSAIRTDNGFPESPRDSRRPHILRGWGHEHTEKVFT
jgi:putative transposase